MAGIDGGAPERGLSPCALTNSARDSVSSTVTEDAVRFCTRRTAGDALVSRSSARADLHEISVVSALASMQCNAPVTTSGWVRVDSSRGGGRLVHLRSHAFFASRGTV